MLTNLHHTVFDYQKTAIAAPTGSAVEPAATSSDLAPANTDIVLPTQGAAPPSYAQSQPDPANPQGNGQ